MKVWEKSCLPSGDGFIAFSPWGHLSVLEFVLAWGFELKTCVHICVREGEKGKEGDGKGIPSTEVF